jgi:opacity protein-like surface antigen
LKKLMLLAAMLAMVLAAAAPAIAQGNVLSENAVGTQVGQGNVQCVQNASQDSAQLQYAGAGNNVNVQAIAAQYQYATPEATATATALPPTGGSVPFSGALALGAGALLVAGGLLARRIVR